jgi:hypothetical protein
MPTVLSIADLQTELGVSVTDNVDKLNTAARVRLIVGDLIASAINRLDDKPLLNLRIFNSGRSGGYEVGEGVLYDNGSGYALYRCTTAHIGAWNGANFSLVGTSGNSSYASGITAFAGGGQASATVLSASKNRVDVVATSLDSVKFIPAVAGNGMIVVNNASNSMNVYPASGENYLGEGANAPIEVVGGQSLEVFCYTTGVWTINN